MKIAIDGLSTETRTLEEIIESETLAPHRIGFCSNIKGNGPTGANAPCCSRIMSDDVEALDLPGNKFICGPCLDDLFALKSQVGHIDVDKSKRASDVRWRTGYNISAKIIREPRVPRGPKA